VCRLSEVFKRTAQVKLRQIQNLHTVKARFRDNKGMIVVDFNIATKK
jgi:hypothetical protein